MNIQTKLMKAIKEFGIAKRDAANTSYELTTRAINEEFAEDRLKLMLKLVKQW